MRNQTMALGAALLMAIGVNAQTTTTQAIHTESGMHQCISITDEAAWTSLGLKPDQMTRVKAIQADCAKACAAMTAEEKTKQERGTMDKHEEQIKAVLTSEQYTNWRKWCAAKAGEKAEKSKTLEPELKK